MISVVIPIVLHKGALDCVMDFFIAEAENADLAALLLRRFTPKKELGQGFSTRARDKSIAR